MARKNVKLKKGDYVIIESVGKHKQLMKLWIDNDGIINYHLL